MYGVPYNLSITVSLLSKRFEYTSMCSFIMGKVLVHISDTQGVLFLI